MRLILLLLPLVIFTAIPAFPGTIRDTLYKKTILFADSVAAFVKSSPRVYSWAGNKLALCKNTGDKAVTIKNAAGKKPGIVRNDTLILDSASLSKVRIPVDDKECKKIRMLCVSSFTVTEDSNAAINKLSRVRLSMTFMFADSMGFRSMAMRSIDAPCERTVWELDNGQPGEPPIDQPAPQDMEPSVPPGEPATAEPGMTEPLPEHPPEDPE